MGVLVLDRDGKDPSADLEPAAVFGFESLGVQGPVAESGAVDGAAVADEGAPFALFDDGVDPADGLAVGSELATGVAADQEARSADLNESTLGPAGHDEQANPGEVCSDCGLSGRSPGRGVLGFDLRPRRALLGPGTAQSKGLVGMYFQKPMQVRDREDLGNL